MKKVLILAYDFPPYNSIGGQRPYGWYAYFHESNIQLDVITRQWNVEEFGNENAYLKAGFSDQVIVEKSKQGTIYYTPYRPSLRDKLSVKSSFFYRLLSKFLSLLQMLSEVFCFVLDNKKGIYFQAKQLLQADAYDYIMVSGEPFVLFRYARKLSKQYDTKWIADYRDGWSWNHTRKNPLIKWYLKQWEVHITKSATCITTVSKSFKQTLATLFPNKLTHVIYNGYFHKLFEAIDTPKKETFQIAFSGTLYDYQPIEMFFKALSAISASDLPESFELVFYGIKSQTKQAKRIQHFIKDHPQWNVRLTKKLPQETLISSLNQASLCLLPANPKHPQIYAKVFEYIALNKPILYFQPDGSDLDDVLKSYSNVFPCQNVQEIIVELKHFFSQDFQITQTKVDKQFTRQYQVKRLAALLS